MYKHFKRFFDIISSLLAIIVLAIPMALLAFLVRVKLGGPIIFKQDRPGKDGEIFTLMKFRTMTNQCDENGNLLPDEVRLTKFGVFLRSTSLDELPELFNILKGDMSVIGPRPLLVQYLDRYNEHQARRHLVKPGLSGWAQVNGRNAISWEQKFDYDVEYVNNISLMLDVKILLMTIINVIKKDGISSETSVTMEEFMGSEEKEIVNV
ncbi:MAG: sugar transferase [Eubacterium sp.]|nr:sugar transferase [Eubacterium sp.]